MLTVQNSALEVSFPVLLLAAGALLGAVSPSVLFAASGAGLLGLAAVAAVRFDASPVPRRHRERLTGGNGGLTGVAVPGALLAEILERVRRDPCRTPRKCWKIYNRVAGASHIGWTSGPGNLRGPLRHPVHKMTQDNTHDWDRRRFVRTTGIVAGALALGGVTTGSALADASNNPAMPGRVYADGRMFATRGLTDLPPPSDGNEHSFDEIYHFVNGAEGQLDVAEAAPGEQDFNGGRWSVTVVEWTIENPPVVKSDDAVHAHADYISVLQEGARYFECPLVPLGK